MRCGSSRCCPAAHPASGWCSIRSRRGMFARRSAGWAISSPGSWRQLWCYWLACRPRVNSDACQACYPANNNISIQKGASAIHLHAHAAKHTKCATASNNSSQLQLTDSRFTRSRRQSPMPGAISLVHIHKSEVACIHPWKAEFPVTMTNTNYGYEKHSNGKLQTRAGARARARARRRL